MYINYKETSKQLFSFSSTNPASSPVTPYACVCIYVYIRRCYITTRNKHARTFVTVRWTHASTITQQLTLEPFFFSPSFLFFFFNSHAYPSLHDLSFSKYKTKLYSRFDVTSKIERTRTSFSSFLHVKQTLSGKIK